MKNSILLICLISVLAFSNAQILNPNTTGSFIFTPDSPLHNKLIEVFYHIPDGDITTMPVLLSFHGATRNANEYRDYWVSMANNNGFMVFAPEFSETYYSGGDGYQLANIFDDGDNPSLSSFNNQNEWTFSVLDPLFEYIKLALSGTQDKYNAWGHSGGAQFLHRYVTYMPDSKLDVAICSNAGWYTVPENTVSFPYGILNGQLSNTNLTSAFSKKLIIHLGQNDTNPNSAGLRHNTTVDNQQGTYRLARGRYFFNTAQTTSQSMSAFFNWELHEVSGIGHDAQSMANDALQYLLNSSLSYNKLINSIALYPNPTTGLIVFNNANLKLKQVKLISILGLVVATYDTRDYKYNQELDITNYSPGLYFLQFDNKMVKILKK